MILFTGEYTNNNGPENVNKGLIREFTRQFTYIRSKNKILKRLEIIGKCIRADVIIASGVFSTGIFAFKVAKFFKKKCIYIMHGCVEYESEVNSEPNEKGIVQERFLLDKADCILAVSEKFMKWVRGRYPQYSKKVGYLNNGIIKPEFDRTNITKEKGLVIAVGGDRKTKNNQVTSDAIEWLSGRARFEIYGVIHGGEMPEERLYTAYKGLVPMETLYQRMAKAELFVLNSIFEPFSLSVIDALNCGCSVLLSEAAGINGLLQLKECDIIHDPNNKEEIAKKINYLLEHSNYERIVKGINYDELSFRKEAEKLEDICNDIMRKRK